MKGQTSAVTCCAANADECGNGFICTSSDKCSLPAALWGACAVSGQYMHGIQREACTGLTSMSCHFYEWSSLFFLFFSLLCIKQPVPGAPHS